MAELGRQTGPPATEYKANHLLREKHRSALVWLLGPSSPLPGHAHVYLLDKEFFVVGKAIELFVGGVDRALAVGLEQDEPHRALAITVRRARPGALRPPQGGGVPGGG